MCRPPRRTSIFSQPAISHALAKLRAMLDDPLFIRCMQRLLGVPTGTARAVAEPIHAALRELVAALDGAGSSIPRNRRASFVSNPLAGEMSRFPALASRVLAEAPHVHLISTAFGAAIWSLRWPTAISTSRSTSTCPSRTGWGREPFGVESLLVAARIGNDRIAGALDLDRYLALDHAFATPRPHGPGIEDIALARLGLQRRVAVRCQHAITAWGRSWRRPTCSARFRAAMSACCRTSGRCSCSIC